MTTRTRTLVLSGTGLILTVLIVTLLSSLGSSGFEQPANPHTADSQGEPPREAPLDVGRLESELEPSSLIRTELNESEEQPKPLTVVVRGQAFDSTNHPLDDVQVRWTSNLYGSVTAMTSHSAGYAIGSMFPGPWRVTADAPGYASTTRSVEIASSPLEQIVDIQLSQARLLRIRIVDPTGSPVSDSISLGEDSAFRAGDLIAIATSHQPALTIDVDAEWLAIEYGVGRYHRGESARRLLAEEDADASLAGVLELNTRDPIFISLVLRNTVVDTRNIAPEAEEVTFVVSMTDMLTYMSKVGLRLLDADTGAPVEGALVELHAERYGSPKEVLSDDDGMAILEHEAPGGRILKITANDYSPVFRYVRLQAGGSLNVGDVSLSKPVVFRATVRDETGDPVGCGFWYRQLTGEGTGLDSAYRFSWRPGETNSDDRTGQLQMTLPRGRILVMPSSADYATVPVVVDTTAGWVPEHTITLRKGTQCTLDWELPGVRSALIIVRNASQQAVAWYYGVSGKPESLALGLGKHTVELWGEQDKRAEAEFVVGNNDLALWFGQEGLRKRNM